MEKILKEILNYSKHLDIVSPIPIDEINKFEVDNHLLLPKDLKTLLTCFDGGEIFVPGPIIYGIRENINRQQIKQANSIENRRLFSIPNNYLIIAKLNYGDLICINLNEPFDIIQWDHETDSLYCSWDSLSEWLVDNVESFKQFEEDEQ